ncbi:hypothetical protein [Myxococcus xanthus]|uniref:hypothetical protein n=1 Tax=Myxococcus xanthus TaxID=34 RepID=UPI00112BC6F7|nr:hypothetical protein [Myxococcus xanthus]QDE86276.1 hypothetical protein BHS07_34705 [Myxococcus xanthus]QDF08234.1 hypothetical protein BHS04_34235 [Myxococcus xanthus]
MKTERELFNDALSAQDDAYLDAEAQLRGRGAAAVAELSRHLADPAPLPRLLARTLTPWIEGKAPDNDKALAYLEALPGQIAETPAQVPRTGGVPVYLGRHFQDRVVEVLALRLVKVPSLPRWYALGVILYLGQQRKASVTEALLRFAIETRTPERRRYAADALRAIGDPELPRKLAAERARLATRAEPLPAEVEATTSPLPPSTKP